MNFGDSKDLGVLTSLYKSNLYYVEFLIIGLGYLVVGKIMYLVSTLG